MRVRAFAAGVAGFLLCVAVFSTTTAFAERFQVVAFPTTDAVDIAPGDGVCEGALGSCTLRAAIMEANALPGRDTIELDRACSGVFLSTPGRDEDGSATGDLDILDDLRIIATPWCNEVFANSLDRVLDIHPGAQVEISGLDITQGDADGSGGGIRNRGRLTLIDSRVTDCTSDASGGGIANEGTMELLGGEVAGNRSTGSSGAGIYNTGTLEITNTLILENQTFFAGGGILNSGSLNVRGVTIGRNDAEAGGGIWTDGVTAISQSTLVRNSAGSSGGGLQHSGGRLSVTRSSISQNFGNNGGGAIWSSHDGVCEVSYSTISANITGDGAAIETSGCQLRISDSTISGNAATVGSAVVATDFAITHSTITNNRILDGDITGVILGTGSLHNTILAGNHGPDCYSPSNITSLGYNLIGDGDSCPGINESTDLRGTTANPLDPRLSHLGANGGPTLTHLPLPDSPAIDAGSRPPWRGDRELGCPRRDQRGARRPMDGGGNGRAICDIGAVEVKSEQRRGKGKFLRLRERPVR